MRVTPTAAASTKKHKRQMNASSSLRRRPPQISLGFMMLMMVIFSIMSAGLFYASRVPAVQDEISVLVHGKSDGASEDVGRLAHITFIMFTFTSPLILAGVLSTGMALLRCVNRSPAVLAGLQTNPLTRWFFR